eukprot:scaffold2761_cov148-Isochrysis_galbana.AAC.3
MTATSGRPAGGIDASVLAAARNRGRTPYAEPRCTMPLPPSDSRRGPRGRPHSLWRAAAAAKTWRSTLTALSLCRNDVVVGPSSTPITSTGVSARRHE